MFALAANMVGTDLRAIEIRSAATPSDPARQAEGSLWWYLLKVHLVLLVSGQKDVISVFYICTF